MRAISYSWEGPAVASRHLRRKKLKCLHATEAPCDGCTRSYNLVRPACGGARRCLSENPTRLRRRSTKRPYRAILYAAFRYRGFVFFALGNFVSFAGRQMLTIAIEWEVYARTHSATALGLVGLVAAVPIIALSLPAGHLADRFSRKSIILLSQAASASCSVCLALISWNHLAIPRIPLLLRGNKSVALPSRPSSSGTRRFTSTISPCR